MAQTSVLERKQEIYALVAAAAVIAVGFGIIAPVLPQFAETFDVTTTQITLVVSAFAAFRLVFAPVSGILVEKFGARSTYLVGLLIVAASTGACAIAGSYYQLLAFRALGGIGSTMFTVSVMGLLAVYAPPAQRGRVMGLYAGAFIFGTMIGPAIGGVLGEYGLNVPFYVYAVGLLVAAGIVAVFLRRSPEGGGDGAAPKLPPLTVKEARQDRAYLAVLYASFMNGWTNFGMRMALIPLFVLHSLELGPFIAGLAFTAFAVGNAIVTPFAGRLSDKHGRRPFIIAGTILCGLGTMVIGWSDSRLLFLSLSVVTGMGVGMYFSPMQAVIADVLGNERSGGKVIAGAQMFQDTGAIVGPIVAGIIVDQLGYGVAFTIAGAMLASSSFAWLRARETLVAT